MHTQVHRKALVISAVLTAFLLASAAGGLFLVNRFTATPADAAGAAQPIAAPVQPAGISQPVDSSLQQVAVDTASNDAVVAAYEAQLQEAYTALQEAYAQIDLLQASQSQPVLRGERDHDDDDDERFLSFGEHEGHDND